jgi:hypothetical protein
MAVYQISKIQIRRGKANSETGFPQLASGEMGWAIDTQELYIGNGSIAEGAPYIGKTKILTSRDLSSSTGNLISLLPYTYRATSNSPIVTGPSASFPVSRSIQTRLDDNVTSADFATVGDGITDNTILIQRAITQLFSNPTADKAFLNTPDGITSRVTLKLPPGTYIITNAINIPSYVTLVGAGIDKTIIQNTQTSDIFRFLDDVNSTADVTTPRYVTIRGMTLSSPDGLNAGINATNLSDSLFEDLKIVGSWSGGSSFNDHNAIYLKNSLNNRFNNITINSYGAGIRGNSNVANNTFNNVSIEHCNFGINLGTGLTSNGPFNTQVTNLTLTDITNNGILVENGTNNSISNVSMANVGGLDLSPTHPQICFNDYRNSVSNLRSVRATVMASPSAILPRFVPIAVGHVDYDSTVSNVNITVVGNTTALVRFPIPTDSEGNNAGISDVTYTLGYSYKSNHLSRQGVITIYVPPNPTSLTLSLSDDYTCTGSITNSVLLEFSVSVLNNNVSLNYLNSYAGDTGVFSYKYTAVS